MAVLKPFKGFRPPAEHVKEVASRPYDVLNSEEARAEAAGNAGWQPRSSNAICKGYEQVRGLLFSRDVLLQKDAKREG